SETEAVKQIEQNLAKSPSRMKAAAAAEGDVEEDDEDKEEAA
ncbi:MAG: CarD family transcriptional regulator, partial [Pseudomonadota bacterium]